MERLWADLAPIGLPDSPPASRGWITVQDLAGRLKIAKQTAHLRLQRLLQDGKVERIKARGRNGAPPTYYYRPVRS